MSKSNTVYRFRVFNSKLHVRTGYRHSVEIADEASEKVLCTCHLFGNACLVPIELLQDPQPPLQLQPDRKIMPSRWTLSTADGRALTSFARKSLASALINPLGKTVLTVFDETETEAGRLIDPRTSMVDRVIGSGPGEWHFVLGSEVLARLTRLPAQRPKPTTVLGRLLDVFMPSDRALVSAGPEHALSAPAALAMLLLFDDLTDTS